ncbi:hypothetical protein ACFVRD_43855 [Streptomyces sp. NPDC057908]|uniref:hypothetical protein n=1 Tax=unclassified Streptomyces TaxID=2593676 RepID=UPI0036B9B603
MAHAAAIAWHAVKAGEPLTVLSLEPEPYAGIGITPLNSLFEYGHDRVDGRFVNRGDVENDKTPIPAASSVTR